ncbi:MAG TPA: NAD(P)H-hydrate dehydratase, partial [Acidimicrobiales bacterium]|nr:NAD(P)H-hydrate dehydratase [Acidimicrobiales bacterium]
MPDPDARVDGGLLAAWPLPRPGEDGDKHDRGLVVVIGGSATVPGAVLLAGVAALRSGAGKLRLATAASAAVPLALAVPEAMVVGLAEDDEGALSEDAAQGAADLVSRARAVVVGPGTTAGAAVSALAGAVVDRVAGGAEDVGDGDGGREPAPVLVLDAGAIAWLTEAGAVDRLAALGGRVVVTPNPDEMGRCFDCDEREIEADPGAVARRAA